ncbi:MAG: sodium:solute symporter, partial [Candidatus Aminicenantes bacterium]|nr:sodium:solute symporter [Candidatus Aminicenantes bacterium]
GILPPAETAAMTREHRNDLVSLPFALAWQISMLMLPMQLIIRQYRDATVTGGVLAVALAGLYIFWYKRLPK